MLHHTLESFLLRLCVVQGPQPHLPRYPSASGKLVLDVYLTALCEAVTILSNC